MHCDVLLLPEISNFNNPTPLLLPLYFALYILKVMGRLHVLSQTKVYPNSLGRCH